MTQSELERKKRVSDELEALRTMFQSLPKPIQLSCATVMRWADLNTKLKK